MEPRRDPIGHDTDDEAGRDGEPPAADAPRLGLADLAEAAGVSVRTVRYYIAEGLLPPPHGAGPRSAYSPGHLDRLRLIDRLKGAYLPLREIRRRLDGLDDPAVRALLDRLGPPIEAPVDRALPFARGAASPPSMPPVAPPDDAAEYLARVLGRRPTPPTAPSPAAARSVELRAPPPEQKEGGDTRSTPDVNEDDAPTAALALDPALALLPPAPEPFTGAESWRRVRLGPDAELLIRDDAYRRRPDRIDWLIRWARKVFES